MRLCSIVGCVNKHVAKDMCRKHYALVRYHTYRDFFIAYKKENEKKRARKFYKKLEFNKWLNRTI